jgi:X-X-X-Leu-X-X-Gly heptad repeat protein
MKKKPVHTGIPRAALALLLVVSLLQLTNLMGGSPSFAHAEDTGQQATPGATGGSAPGATGDATGSTAPDATTAEPTTDATTTAPTTATTPTTPTAPTTDATTDGTPTPTTTAAPATATTTSNTAGTAAIDDRQEVIYGLLDANGTPHSGYVVNRLQVQGAGTFSDEGDYRSVRNLTSTAVLTLNGKQVSGPVGTGDFYYEGVLSTVRFPWLIDISYTLDGKTVTPAQLAGSTGKLSIHIKTEKNASVDPVFFENYLLQIQLTLEEGKARDVSAPDATIASAGANQQVAFTVLPNREGDLRLEAQVTDFEMPGIQVSALPFSMVFDIPDTDDMLADMETLADAIGELNAGVQKLNDGVKDMEGGAAALTSGSDDLNKGLTLLSKNSVSLTAASSQIDGALRVIVEQLENNAVDPTQIEQLVGGLRQLAAGLYSGDAAQPGLAEGLGQIQGGITTATTTMDGLIAALAPIADQTALATLMAEAGALTPGSQLTLQSLVNTNVQALSVQGFWYGPNGNDGVKAGLDSAAAGLGASIGSCQYMAGQLNMIADGLESGLSGIAGLQLLTAALQDLSNGYSDFNTGLATYTDGVDTLAKNYDSFNSGLSQLLSGVSDLRVGTSSLYNGTSELYANVEDLPETMQKEIDSFLEDYQASDFTPVSFVSKNSEHLSRVQFVLVSDPIKAEVPDAPIGDAPASEQTFWDRLVALFS